MSSSEAWSVVGNDLLWCFKFWGNPFMWVLIGSHIGKCIHKKDSEFEGFYIFLILAAAAYEWIRRGM